MLDGFNVLFIDDNLYGIMFVMNFKIGKWIYLKIVI